MRRFCLGFVALVSVVLMGCIPVGAWLGVKSMTKNKGGGTVVLSPPVASNVIAQNSADSQPVKIDFQLIDQDSSLCDIQAEYSLDNGATWNPCTLSGAYPTSGLTSSAQGIAHSLRWDYKTDFPTGSHLSALVRISPKDSSGDGVADTSAPVRIGNTAPSVQVNISGTHSGDVNVSYTITDSESDKTSVVVEYSLDSGANWGLATLSAGASEGISTLSTSPTGEVHNYLWNSNIVNPGGAVQNNVQIRITPSDPLATGNQATSATFILDAQNKPNVIALVGTSQSTANPVKLTYKLADLDSSLVNLNIQYSTDGGTNYNPCTAGVGGDGITNLTSSPSGIPHTYYWDYKTDIPSGSFTGVKIKITPTDSSGAGVDTISGGIRVGNTAPSVQVTMAGTETGDVNINYTLIDSESDSCSIAVEYSLDGGLNWALATQSASPPEETTSLSTSPGPSGVAHVFRWNSTLVNPSGAVQTNVQIRITPSDALVTGATTTTGTFTLDAQNKPNVTNLTATSSPDATPVTLGYKLVDPDSSPVAITVEYSIDGGTTYQSCASAGGDGTTSLASTPSGVAHTFLWDYTTNIPSGAHTNVKIRITPSDSSPGPYVPAIVSNVRVGNTAPSASVTMSGTTYTGNVPVNYTLFDSQGDQCSVVVEYSLDNGTSWAVATLAPNPPEQISNLTASIAGEAHSFLWDSALVNPGGVVQSNVKIRITPSDALAIGTPATSGSFSLDSMSPPDITNLTATSSSDATPVTISYKLLDPDSSSIGLAVQYSIDNGTTWTDCTEGPGGDGKTNLTSSSAGITHTFVWNYKADIPTLAYKNAQIKVIPTDNSASGNPRIVGSIRLGNSAPTAIFSMSGTHSDKVTINYTLKDGESDRASVIIEYSLNGGTNWAVATRAGTLGEGLTSLATDPVGLSHTFIWDSTLANPTGAVQNNVKIRITPSDALVAGATATSGAFALDTLNAPDINNLTATSQAGPNPVTITYQILDSDSSPTSVNVQYSTNGTNWNPCTLGAGGDGVTNLASSPSGVSHTFVWNYKADIPTSAYTNAQIKITPSDNAGAGTPRIVGNIRVGNTPPLVTVSTPPTSSGDVTINYTLKDGESDTCSVIVEYSLNGGTSWAIATASATSGPTTGLATNSTGIAYSFTWDSALANPTGAVQNQVQIRIKPSDALVAGSAIATNPFSLDGLNKPVVNIISTTSEPTANPVTVIYKISDQDSSPVNLDVKYSVDGGTTWLPATSGGGDGVTALSSNPAGEQHTFLWNYKADIPTGAVNSALIQITPSDGTSGIVGPVQSATFRIGNSAPSVSLSMSGTYNGDVSINYTLTDGEADNCSIQVQFSLDNGTTWSSATLSINAGEVTTGLVSSTTGVPHAFLWDSKADTLPLSYPNVMVQILPSDSLNNGVYGTSGAFILNNINSNTGITNLTATDQPLNADVTITYSLVDSTSTSTNIAVEYSTDYGQNWIACTMGTGGDGVSSLTASPGGTAHVYRWNYRANIPTGSALNVKVRITPTNINGQGIAGIASGLRVGNTAPVVNVFVSGTQSGNIIINYVVTDAENDDISVKAQYYGPDPVTLLSTTWQWRSATTAGGSGVPGASYGDPLVDGSDTDPNINNRTNIRKNIAITSPGQAQVYLWDSLIDKAGKTSMPGIKFQIQATDIYGISGGWIPTANTFTVDNGSVLNDPPSVSIVGVSPVLQKNYRFKIVYKLIDSESNPCAIQVEWTVNSGASWFSCQRVSNPSNITLDGGPIGDPTVSDYTLISSSSGKDHAFVWDVLGDTNFKEHKRIKVRITVFDRYGKGGVAETPDTILKSFPSPRSLANTDPNQGEVPIVVDGKGNLHLVWGDTTSGSNEIYYNRYYDDRAWSPTPQKISIAYTDSTFPAMAIDGSDNIHVVWQGGSPPSEIYYSFYNGSVWSTPQNISKTSGDSSSPAIAIDSSGNLHVAWSDNTSGNYEFYYSFYNGGGWSSLPKIINTSGGGLSIATDGSNLLRAVWQVSDLYSNTSDIYYSLYNGSIWSTPQKIASTSTSNSEPAITIDERGNLHVVWKDNTSGNHEIYYSSYNGSSWSTPQDISNTSGGSYSPSIATDENGNIHTVWSDNTSGNAEIYYTFYNGNIWFPIQNISNNSGDSFHPSIAIDGWDNLHIVWKDKTSGSYEIYYNRIEIPWSNPQKIANTSGDSGSPSITTDGGGNIHAVWEDGSSGAKEIYYSIYNGSAWSAPQNLSNTSGDSRDPAIAIDGSGNIHLVWYDNTSGSNEIYYTFYNGTTWSTSQKISIPGNSIAPSIAIDGSGNIYVVWEYGPGTKSIYYTFHNGTTWSAPQNISTAGNSVAPSIAVDGSGDIHVVYGYDVISDYEIYYRLYNGSFWSTPKNLSLTSGNSNYPSIVVDVSDNLYVVWEDNTPGNYEIYYTIYNGSGWSPHQNISNTSGSSQAPSIAIDGDGNRHAVWRDDTSGSSAIYYSKLRKSLTLSPHTYPFTTDPAPTWTYSGFTHDLINKLMNANAVNGTLESPVIDASSPDNTYYTTVYLKLKHAFAPKAGGLLDTAKIEISYYDTATTSWTAYAPVLQMTENTGAVSKDLHVNLSKWAAGRKFKIRFSFTNGAGEGSWKIDDVEIRASKYSFVYRP